jgi:hypothetical protein
MRFLLTKFTVNDGENRNLANGVFGEKATTGISNCKM